MGIPLLTGSHFRLPTTRCLQHCFEVPLCQCPQGFPCRQGQLSFCCHPAYLWTELGAGNHTPFYTNWSFGVPLAHPWPFSISLASSSSLGLEMWACLPAHVTSPPLLSSSHLVITRLLQSCSQRKHVFMRCDLNRSEAALSMPLLLKLALLSAHGNSLPLRLNPTLGPLTKIKKPRETIKSKTILLHKASLAAHSPVLFQIVRLFLVYSQIKWFSPVEPEQRPGMWMEFGWLLGYLVHSTPVYCLRCRILEVWGFQKGKQTHLMLTYEKSNSKWKEQIKKISDVLPLYF